MTKVQLLIAKDISRRNLKTLKNENSIDAESPEQRKLNVAVETQSLEEYHFNKTAEGGLVDYPIGEALTRAARRPP